MNQSPHTRVGLPSTQPPPPPPPSTLTWLLSRGENLVISIGYEVIFVKTTELKQLASVIQNIWLGGTIQNFFAFLFLYLLLSCTPSQVKFFVVFGSHPSQVNLFIKKIKNQTTRYIHQVSLLKYIVAELLKSVCETISSPFCRTLGTFKRTA